MRSRFTANIGMAKIPPSAAGSARSMSRTQAVCGAALTSRTAHARYRGYVAMRFAADIVLDAQLVALIEQEARLPIARVIFGVVNGDDDLDLVRTDLPQALDRTPFVAGRRAGGVREGLGVETRALDHQRVALELADRMAVVPGEADEGLLIRHRLVHGDHADLVAELVKNRDLAGRPMHDLERIGIRPHARHPVGHAELARFIRKPAILQTGHVLGVGGLAGIVERQLAAADELDLGVVSGGPINPR